VNTLLERVRTGRPIHDTPVIDMHGHLGRYNFGIPELRVRSLVEEMDRMGVASILVSHMQAMGDETDRGNQEVLQAMRAYPGRIRGYVVVWPKGQPAVRQEVEDRFEDGFTGVKLHSGSGFFYGDAAYEPALEICNERRRPLLLHTWAEEETFEFVRDAATRYPDIAILLAHAAVQREDEYVALARDHEHVYLDPTMSSTPRGLWERLTDKLGPEKLVWGSDAWFFSATPQLGKLAGAEISEEAKRTILGGTATKILERAE
jgi:hypothetical protein